MLHIVLNTSLNFVKLYDFHILCKFDTEYIQINTY